MSKKSIRNNSFSGVFHMFIIAIFLLGLSGCGYKADPFYTEDAPAGDENVEFKLRKVNIENNENDTCEKKK